jgi:hypothetical protein
MELLGVECGRYRGRKTTPTERRVSKDGSGGSRLSTLQFWDGSVSPQRRGARCHLYVNAVLRARVTTVGKFSRGCATAVCPRLVGSARRKNLLTYLLRERGARRALLVRINFFSFCSLAQLLPHHFFLSSGIFFLTRCIMRTKRKMTKRRIAKGGEKRNI